MRVAILIRRFSTRGGNERQAFELARHLCGAGHDVHVYCHKADETAVLPDANVHVLPGIRFDPTAAMLSYAWSTRRLVRRLRREDRIDRVIGFGQSVEQDVYRLGGGTHAQFLVATKDHPGARGGPVLDRVALRLERIRLRPDRSPHLVAPSHRVADELVRHYGVATDRIHVVWNGTDLERFQPGPAEDLGWRDDRPLALFVGQDPHRKGFDIAAEATRRLGARLVYVGRGDRPGSLPDHVLWAGERRDMERVYRSADVLIAPSRYDPFGGVVLEAAACGRASVATRRIGATERFADSPLDALLVEDPEDIDGVTKALESALGDHAALGAAARDAVADASIQAWGERMVEVLSLPIPERVR
ncbi:MAG: glycosyltransferase family 4 protein [Deltaproteobacteria bacterium]